MIWKTQWIMKLMVNIYVGSNKANDMSYQNVIETVKNWQWDIIRKIKQVLSEKISNNVFIQCLWIRINLNNLMGHLYIISVKITASKISSTDQLVMSINNPLTITPGHLKPIWLNDWFLKVYLKGNIIYPSLRHASLTEALSKERFCPNHIFLDSTSST